MSQEQELLMQQFYQCMNLFRRGRRGRQEGEPEEREGQGGLRRERPPHGGPYHGGPYHGGPSHGGPHHGGPYHGKPCHGGPYHGGPFCGMGAEEDGRRGHMHRGQGRLLTLLLEKDGMALKEIVQEMDIRPSSATELTAKLEQAGLVERRENPEDKRVVNIYLTEEGRTRARELLEGRQERAAELFNGLTEEEQRQLSSLLGKLIDSWKEKTA